jgi:hypothetical protein
MYEKLYQTDLLGLVTHATIRQVRLESALNIDYRRIDHSLRGVIRQLNESGYTTCFCCGGKQRVNDKKHSLGAYILFLERLPKDIRMRAEKLNITGETQNVLRAPTPIWRPEDQVKENKEFTRKIQKIFNLK